MVNSNLKLPSNLGLFLTGKRKKLLCQSKYFVFNFILVWAARVRPIKDKTHVIMKNIWQLDFGNFFPHVGRQDLDETWLEQVNLLVNSEDAIFVIWDARWSWILSHQQRSGTFHGHKWPEGLWWLHSNQLHIPFRNEVKNLVGPEPTRIWCCFVHHKPEPTLTYDLSQADPHPWKSKPRNLHRT